MVIDKETKMRETLRIMSMKTGAYGLSFFCTELIFTLITAIILTIIYGAKGIVNGAAIIPLFFIMLLLGIGMLFMSMVITTLFRDSKLSVQIGSLILSLPFIFFISLFNID